MYRYTRLSVPDTLTCSTPSGSTKPPTLVDNEVPVDSSISHRNGITHLVKDLHLYHIVLRWPYLSLKFFPVPHAPHNPNATLQLLESYFRTTSFTALSPFQPSPLTYYPFTYHYSLSSY